MSATPPRPSAWWPPRAAYGGLEILVHNAGGPPAGPFTAVTEPQWAQAFEQNLMSFVRIVHAAVPEMKKAGYGRVLTIASSSIKQPIPNLVLSNAFRAGVWGLAKTMSHELAPHGILVNVIAPGRIATERIDELDRANAERSGKALEDVKKASVASIRSGASASPRSSPTSSSSSPRRAPVTSPGRACSWTAPPATPCSGIVGRAMPA